MGREFCRICNRGSNIGRLLCREIRGLAGIISCSLGGGGNILCVVLDRGLMVMRILRVISEIGSIEQLRLGLMQICIFMECFGCTCGLNQLQLIEISHLSNVNLFIISFVFILLSYFLYTMYVIYSIT